MDSYHFLERRDRVKIAYCVLVPSVKKEELFSFSKYAPVCCVFLFAGKKERTSVTQHYLDVIDVLYQ